MEHITTNTVPELLEPADVARLLGLMPASIHRMTAAGELSMAARTMRGTRLYRREEVERLIEQRNGRCGR